MKFTKMSLVAALLIGSSAFAIENTKVSGDAKLYYQTMSYDDNTAATNDGNMFDRANSAGQAAVGLGITTDLAKGISAGVHTTILTTLGLENNLVGGVWAGNIAPNAGTTTGDALAGSNGTGWWIDNAWVAATTGKTTAKVGRMDLDTPLAFTETWNIAQNTFEAFVVLNQDLPDTTLVGAYVGGSNGANGTTVQNAQDGKTPFTGYTTYNDGVAGSFGGRGAYAAGAINNSYKPLTAQAWYYDVVDVATAYWLQADLNLDGILVGAQYANMNPSDVINVVGGGQVPNTFKDSSGYAVMLGYAMKDVATLKVAYSAMADDGILNIQNTATGDQTKFYTEAWWNYGVVGSVGAQTIMVNAETTQAGIDFLAQYTAASVDAKGNGSAATMNEFTLTAGKSYGPLDTTLAYIHTDMDNKAGGNTITGNPVTKFTSDIIQVYLTLKY
ncbi:hypothetical protein [Sulfurimonas sp.]